MIIFKGAFDYILTEIYGSIQDVSLRFLAFITNINEQKHVWKVVRN